MRQDQHPFASLAMPDVQESYLWRPCCDSGRECGITTEVDGDVPARRWWRGRDRKSTDLLVVELACRPDLDEVFGQDCCEVATTLRARRAQSVLEDLDFIVERLRTRRRRTQQSGEQQPTD